MDEGLYTISGVGSSQVRDRGSRFLAFAHPVTSLEEIQQVLALYRKTYHDARHHCYAWRLGPKGEPSFANDDGEPAHSARTPILSAIRAARVTEVLVVVVRYFGGIKLGVRGLMDAYREAAAAALEGLPTNLLVPKTLFSLDFEYSQTSDINRVLHPYQPEQVEARYDERCHLVLALPEGVFPHLAQALTREAIPFNLIPT